MDDARRPRASPSGRRWPAVTIRFPALADPALSDLVAATLDDFQPTAIQEHDRERGAPRWQVFFASGDDRDRALAALLARFADHGLGASALDVDDENWAARSQAALSAIPVGRFIVAPPWDRPSAPPPGTRVIVIEPSTGFGTGHHATTRLCLAALQTLELAGARVLDIGTGSGILAIAAAMSGATGVHAVDIDEDALASARANAARNAVAHRMVFARLDFRQARLPRADVVFANLTGAILAGAIDPLIDLLVPGGRLVVSGFTSTDLVARREGPLLGSPRVAPVGVDEEEGWAGMVLRRT